jgi:hypothetical protein
MGACLSCLQSRRPQTEPTDRSRLLYDDYPHNAYGTWGGNGNTAPPPDHGISADEERRLQTAWDGITTWAGNQIVEIFPSQHRAQGLGGLNHVGVAEGDEGGNNVGLNGGNGAAEQRERERERQHQDILLSMIPGDKSKRSIRIYPSSRPGSRQTESLNGNGSAHGEGEHKIREKASGVFVKLNVNLP